MIRHILFPSDLSEPTRAAFKQVLELARAFKAKVTLMHAYELLSSSMASRYDLSITSSMMELELSMAEKANLHLGEFKQQLEAAGITCELQILRGQAGERIVAAAEAGACDLIVMGSRGLGPVQSILIGSTSTYVLHHSRIPILVIPVKSA